jgi:hypothetical protein
MRALAAAWVSTPPSGLSGMAGRQVFRPYQTPQTGFSRWQMAVEMMSGSPAKAAMKRASFS